MKKFTKEDIEGVRKYYQSEGYSEVSVEIGDLKFSYFVLPQELFPQLQGFVQRVTGEPQDGAVFGIADTVKEEYRKYAVAHEVIEFTQIGLDAEDRCIRALERELELVPENIKADYIWMRHEFFGRLVEFAEKSPEHFDKEDISEIRKTYHRLEQSL